MQYTVPGTTCYWALAADDRPGECSAFCEPSPVDISSEFLSVITYLPSTIPLLSKHEQTDLTPTYSIHTQRGFNRTGTTEKSVCARRSSAQRYVYPTI